MALQKDLILSDGFVANYWKITRMNLDFLQSIAGIAVSVYKDAAARQAGRVPASERLFTVRGNDFNAFKSGDEAGNTVSLAYAYLKTLSELSGALDV